MKKTVILVIIITFLPIAGFGAEHIPPPFLIDTDTTLYMPLCLDDFFASDSGLELDFPFGISQNLTLNYPYMGLGLGISIGYEQSNLFGARVVPVLAILNVMYNVRFGVGRTLIQETPTASAFADGPTKVDTYTMNFSMPMTDFNGVQFGLLVGIKVYTWKGYDSLFGESTTEFDGVLDIGLNFSYNPISHPLNKLLFPKYTKSFE